MKKLAKNVSAVLSLGMLVSAFSGFQLAGHAAETATKEISLGKLTEFNRVKISYHDDTTTNVGFAYAANGGEFSSVQTKAINGEKTAVLDLGKTAPASADKIQITYDPTYGIPKVELQESVRFGDRQIMGATERGIEGNLNQARGAASDYYDRLFDGRLAFNGDLDYKNDKDDAVSPDAYAMGPAQSFDLYHDAVDKNLTDDWSKGITIVYMDLKEDTELDNITMAINTTNYSGYTIYVAGVDGEYTEAVTKSAEEVTNSAKAEKVVYPYDSFEREGSLYKKDDAGNYIKKAGSNLRNLYLTNDTIDKTVQKIKIKFSDYRNADGSSTNAKYVQMFEMGLYKFETVFSTDYELYDGAQFELQSPVVCQRIVGELPADMWYEGQKADGSWVEFRDRSAAGYSAEGMTEIKAVRIKGFNKVNVDAAALPKKLSFYAAPENLAKKAYEENAANITVDGQAELPEDLKDDPRADYMTGGSETTECLFDGDVQNGKEEIYNIFTVADPYRLTLKEDSSITVKLPKSAIIDSVNYYAGPQYTPRHYYVQVSNSNDFSGAVKVIDKTYELADKGPNEEGHLSPFYISSVPEGAEHDKYYCSMREPQAVNGETTGQYVKITNDGVLKTTGENDIETLTNRYVILAKEVEIIGAELVSEVKTTQEEGSLTITCALNSSNDGVVFTIKNETAEAAPEMALWAAVYNADGTLAKVKGITKTAAADTTENAAMDGLAIGADSKVKAFVWTADGNQTPIVNAITVK